MPDAGRRWPQTPVGRASGGVGCRFYGLMELQVVARRVRSSRNDAGSLLASTFVVSLGAGCTLFMVAAMSPESAPVVLSLIGGLAVLLLAVIIRQRFRRGHGRGLSFVSLLSRQHRTDGLACEYQPEKAIRRRGPAAGQLNRPISVDELREIQTTSLNTWVPARSRHGGRAD